MKQKNAVQKCSKSAIHLRPTAAPKWRRHRRFGRQAQSSAACVFVLGRNPRSLPGERGIAALRRLLLLAAAVILRRRRQLTNPLLAHALLLDPVPRAAQTRRPGGGR